jgi:uncharacterized damage-inducible protein DinB
MPNTQPLDVARELLDAFEHCYRVSEYVVGVLPPRIWRAEPPDGDGRSIAAIVAHVQSVRLMFARLGGADPLPEALDRVRSTPENARRGLQQSREALMALFSEGLSERRPRVKKMPRRMVNMMIYLLEHDAHHRGQICRLARALGHRLSKEDVMRIWGWKKLP